MNSLATEGKRRIEREIYKHKMALAQEVQRNAPEKVLRDLEKKIAQKEALMEYVREKMEQGETQ